MSFGRDLSFTSHLIPRAFFNSLFLSFVSGYGYENTSYYPNATLTFCGIGNIHAVRDAYQKMSALCLSTASNDVHWGQSIEDTRWLSLVRLILSASWQAAFHVRHNRLPVLLHCSHGWDRTSQVSALAQILLDPYYRTRRGFSCLVEKEFMALGHPFHNRCRHGEGRGGSSTSSSMGDSTVGATSSGDENQLSPIFLQFLDATWQIVHQYPRRFEFTDVYILLLSDHVYSCRFGTLLCDTEREREVVAGIRQRTHCLWEYLDSRLDVINPSYVEHKFETRADEEENGALLMPLPSLLRNVTLWSDRHCMYGPKATDGCLDADLDAYLKKKDKAVTKKEDGMKEAAPNATAWTEPTLCTSRDSDRAALRMTMEELEKWKKIAETRTMEVETLKKKLEETGFQEEGKGGC